MNKRVRYAMVGGGEGAFIGAVHRMAARLTGEIDLVAGAFSRRTENNFITGNKEALDSSRIYANYVEMFQKESQRAISERPHFIAIVTPNDSHAPIAIAAMEAGFDVLCDKPMADTLAAAQTMVRAALRTGRRLGITHTYAGYPMVKQARALLQQDGAGAVRRVQVGYTQDWLSRVEDMHANVQAAWRTDPARSGEGGAMGDIGTHAFHLAEYVTGLRVETLCADIRATLAGRSLDDDGSCMLRFVGGARGTLTASQICTGDANALTLSVYCDEIALHWAQESPNRLRVNRRDQPEEIWSPGSNRSYLAAEALAVTRVPAGHPEGYIEAFANIYAAFAADIAGNSHSHAGHGYASADDALACMQFVHAARISSERNAAWVVLAQKENAI
jgi:predicted dehydrogenase